MNKNYYLFLILSFIFISCGEAVGDGSGADGVGDGQHRIFVSSSTHNGNLGGISGADSICASLASSAGLELTYKAFIGDSTNKLLNRFSLSGSVYNFAGVDRFKVVELGGNLFDADNTSLLQMIEYDENGDSVSGLVWTGSDSEGQNTLIEDCSNWSSDNGVDEGNVGDNTRTSGFFLEDAPAQTCDLSYRIYCISI